MSETLEFPYLAAIPYKIISEKNVSAGAKVHFGCLMAWADQSGIVKHTTKKMAAMYEKPESIIQCWHIELENAGFLKIHESHLEVTA